MKHMQKKRYKRFLAVLTGVVCFALAFSAYAEGSWAQINQPVERPENWQQWVMESPFVLGAKTEIGEIKGQKAFEQAYGSYPSLDGSTVAVPLAMELARQHLRLQEEDLAGFVAFSTTHNAYVRLIGGNPNLSSSIHTEMTTMDEGQPVNLIFATEPSPEELALAEAAGVTLKMVPFCYDAFVFLVNGENPISGLTMEQLRQIYVGGIQNWDALGGGELPIMPFQREANSGSQTAMENLVMKGVPMAGVVKNYISGGMGDLVRQIGDYDNGKGSIGYSYLYYVENLYKSGAVKTLALDGVAPTRENIRSGLYPLTTHYYAVYREGDPLGEAFTEWLLSDVGQKCVAQAGYIPMSVA